MGFMLIDYGATFKDVGFGQSLAFGYIDARTVYHEGIIMALTAFLIMTAIAVNEIKNKVE